MKTMNSDSIYCRLCAELKPSSKQVDIESNSVRRSEIIQKLTRINAPTEFIDSKLPSMVCLECICLLNKCIDFVVQVENAQIFLNEISHRNVKKECDSEDEYLAKNDHSDEVSQRPVKIEFQFVAENRDDEMPSTHVQIETNFVAMKTGSSTDDRLKVKPNKNRKRDTISLSELKHTWDTYSWRCTYCDTIFPSLEELQTHAMSAHNACNPYRCAECNHRKGRLDKFLIHVKSHYKHLKYSCYKCLEKFNTITAARKHIKSHVDTKYSCPGCKACFGNSVQLKQHMDAYYKLKKNAVTRELTCLRCSMTFEGRALLMYHLRHMHTETNKYICHACGKGYSNKSSLSTHVIVHTDERPHKCQICKVGFKTERTLKDHIGRHYSDRPFPCTQCGSRFRLLRHLKKHIAIHSDKLPFQCSYCEKRFQRKQYLKNHERLHTGEKPYSCETCQHSFSDWPNYNKHMKQRHNIDTSRKKALLVIKP